jgi:hypothetical protein
MGDEDGYGSGDVEEGTASVGWDKVLACGACMDCGDSVKTSPVTLSGVGGEGIP